MNASLRTLASVTSRLALALGSVTLLAVSCKPSTPAVADPGTSTAATPSPATGQEFLVGEWVSSWIHVELTSAGGTPLERVVDVKEDAWEETFKRTPLHTLYRADGTYYWNYYENDSLVTGPVGFWSIKGDSMFQHDTTMAANDMAYKLIQVNDSLVELRSVVDWEGIRPIPRHRVVHSGTLFVLLPPFTSALLAQAVQEVPLFLETLTAVFQDLHVHGYGFGWFDRVAPGIAPAGQALSAYAMVRQLGV